MFCVQLLREVEHACFEEWLKASNMSQFVIIKSARLFNQSRDESTLRRHLKFDPISTEIKVSFIEWKH